MLLFRWILSNDLGGRFASSTPQTVPNSLEANGNRSGNIESNLPQSKSPPISIQTTPHAGNSNSRPDLSQQSFIPKNPYANVTPQESGNVHAQPNIPGLSRVDKLINLKKGMMISYIHQYTLCLKIIKSQSTEEEEQLIQSTLQKLFDIVLQADPKTIIPPFLELNRNNKSIPDLSNAFQVSAVDSFYSLKKYFFKCLQGMNLE